MSDSVCKKKKAGVELNYTLFLRFSCQIIWSLSGEIFSRPADCVGSLAWRGSQTLLSIVDTSIGGDRTHRLEKGVGVFFDISLSPGRKEHFILALFVSSWVPARALYSRETADLHGSLERHFHAGLRNLGKTRIRTFQTNTLWFDFVWLSAQLQP